MSDRSWASPQAAEEMSRTIQSGRQLTAGRPNYFMVGPRCFDDSQCRLLRDYVDTHGGPAEVFDAGYQGVAAEVRRTRTCWLDRVQFAWAYDIVWTIASTVNQVLRYEIGPTPEDIQVARYDAEDSGYFVWHMDTNPSDMTRKISISVPLNDAAEYDGGVLQLHQGTNVIGAKQDAGVPLIFPSWLVHQVSPVTRGRRYSLVAWIRGPNWR